MPRVTLSAGELAGDPGKPRKASKASKPSVNYGPATVKARSCGTCSMFIAGGRCTDVKGKIDPQDTCDIWESRSGAVKAAQSSAEILREYWTREGHPGPTQYALEEKIRWGEGGDWQRCVDQLTPYIGAEGSHGYCNLRHKEVLGCWPYQHARGECGH